MKHSYTDIGATLEITRSCRSRRIRPACICAAPS